ncbi:MAG: DnaJ domain-containing protein [Bradyrhizobium sp.]|uniref:DnaJ domain-containing protein n=1 Tax=Bradyrhizobium sp. TaxID=376 RepID=UPI001D5C30F4|nr:DnaJ domain-containing protein [Bradyrhizobium sp.]MBV9566013.1 DnaJ domain-containing protein [Bradyrhizobium sp.]
MGIALNLLKHLSRRSPQHRRRRDAPATAWSRPAKLPPTTLYELLRVRADDDAETLQGAFREAVKANHPDVNPGDPDASRRLRQIVTAYGILRDAERREAYDRMLAAERAQRRARLTRIVASDVIAIVSLSAVLLGGYALFAHGSKIPAEATGTVEAAARQSTEMAAVQPAESRSKPAPAEVHVPSAVPSAAGSVEPSTKADGGPVADAAAPKGEAGGAVDVANAGAERRNEVAILAKSDASDPPDPPDQSAARSEEPPPPKDVGTAKSSPASSPRSEEKRSAKAIGKLQTHAIRPAPARQVAAENRDVPPVAPEGRNARATPLFGVGF